MKNVPIAGKPFSFGATLENWAEGMDYCAVSVPEHPIAEPNRRSGGREHGEVVVRTVTNGAR